MTRQFISHDRLWSILFACVIGAAAIGFVKGTSSGEYRPRRFRAAEPSSSAGVTLAVPYLEVGDSPRGVNGFVYGAAFDRLRGDLPSAFEAVATSLQSRRDVIAMRAERRAYDGAPPMVPHRVRQDAASDCLVCHGEGLKVGGLVAPKMSHARYDNCTQCHAEIESSVPSTLASGERELAVANGFEPLSAPERGDRAWPGAPPVIPHTTRMRSNCDSCHGVSGKLGLRTPHPYRQSCTQCHAPAAELDQRTQAQSFLSITPPN